MKQQVNYDALAATYNRRFDSDAAQGVGHALAKLARDAAAERVLEVGCGTGHWLAQLRPLAPRLFGLDLSQGMLAQAQQRSAPLHLVRGTAEQLPFGRSHFDLVYCVNALHHFLDPQAFITEAYRLLRPHGVLAIVGSDPHGRKDSWYVYDYFEGVYERDVARFPRWKTIRGWLETAGFHDVGSRVAERIYEEKVGRAVLDDPFLQKEATSQLALLSDAAYAAGLARIEAAVAAAERRGATLTFRSDITLGLLNGRKPG